MPQLTIVVDALDAVRFTQQLLLWVATGHGDLDALVVIHLQCSQASNKMLSKSLVYQRDLDALVVIHLRCGQANNKYTVYILGWSKMGTGPDWD